MVGYLVIQSFFSSFGVALIWFTIAVYSHYMYNWIDEQTDDRQRQQGNSPSTFYSRERMYIFSIYLHLFLCMFYYLCTTSSVKYSFFVFVLFCCCTEIHYILSSCFYNCPSVARVSVHIVYRQLIICTKALLVPDRLCAGQLAVQRTYIHTCLSFIPIPCTNKSRIVVL